MLCGSPGAPSVPEGSWAALSCFGWCGERRNPSGSTTCTYSETCLYRRTPIHTQEHVYTCSHMHSQTFTNAHIYRCRHTYLPPRTPVAPWLTWAIVGEWPPGDGIGWGPVLQVSHTSGLGWALGLGHSRKIRSPLTCRRPGNWEERVAVNQVLELGGFWRLSCSMTARDW